jgi:hypothetical protein
MAAATARTIPALSADQAAGAICHAMLHRPRVVLPWWAKLTAAGRALAPTLVDDIASRAEGHYVDGK